MNNRESLSHLVEIQYLLKGKNEQLSKIQGERDRISALEKRQSDAALRISTLEEENRSMGLKDKELTLSTLEKEIEKLKGQLSLISSQKEANAIEDTLKFKIEDHTQMENFILILLEKEEQNNKELIDLKNFLLGLESTKKEILEEVSKTTLEATAQLDITERRIMSLMSELSKDNQALFERAKAKHAKNPLSFISNMACKECRMHLNSVLKAQVENMSSIEPCPYCERILLPSNLNY